MGHRGARPQQRQAAVRLPAWTENQQVSLRGLCEHKAKRDVMSLPFEHAVDDNEEEEVVKDALPVRHHHRVGRAHVRLALERQRNSAR